MYKYCIYDVSLKARSCPYCETCSSYFPQKVVYDFMDAWIVAKCKKDMSNLADASDIKGVELYSWNMENRQ